jgi:hypothetical protein
MPSIEEIRRALGKMDESSEVPSRESLNINENVNPFSEKLFAPIEQLQHEIQDKDKIIESLKNESIVLKNKISIVEKEKSTVLEDLNKSRWLENKVTLATKKVYEDKVKSVINENVDSKLIYVLTTVARRKQGNQQLNWGNWLKVPENRYLYEVNEDIAKKIFEDTNALIDRINEETRGSEGPTTTTIYGLEFDGLTNEVTTNFSGSSATPLNKTYSFWLKSTHTARNYVVFGYGSQKKGALTTNFSNGRVLMWNGGSWYTYWEDTSAQDDGEWHHWMVYNDVETIVDSKLYVDGTLIEVNKFVTSGTVSNLNNQTQPLTIMSYQNNSNNTGRHFEGSLTNFAVYSGDKTDDASAHYNNGTPKDLSGESDLQGYWKMDEGAGTTVTDRSGEGNDGTINGASWITVMEK